MGLCLKLVSGVFGWENPLQCLQSPALFGFANLHGVCRELRVPGRGIDPGEPKHKLLVTVFVLRSQETSGPGGWCAGLCSALVKLI